MIQTEHLALGVWPLGSGEVSSLFLAGVAFPLKRAIVQLRGPPGLFALA